VLRLDAWFYPDYVPGFDNDLCRQKILAAIDKGSSVLDLGAGVGVRAYTNFHGCAARVCGVDAIDGVMDNPFLDEAKIAGAENIPYPDASFDVVFAWNVLEHLSTPGPVFAEAMRVLRPGGLFIVKTPNRWHYIALIARCTPQWFHEHMISRVMGWRGHSDVFPTVYRANSVRVMTRLATDAGLSVREILALEPRPEYLRFSPLTFPFGIAYERIVNSSSRLRAFRAVFIGVFQK
jgi:SAM-dependent methyltransferase